MQHSGINHGCSLREKFDSYKHSRVTTPMELFRSIYQPKDNKFTFITRTPVNPLAFKQLTLNIFPTRIFPSYFLQLFISTVTVKRTEEKKIRFATVFPFYTHETSSPLFHRERWDWLLIKLDVRGRNNLESICQPTVFLPFFLENSWPFVDQSFKKSPKFEQLFRIVSI